MPIYPAIVGVDQTTSQFNLRYKDPLSANTTDEIRINPTGKTIHAYDYSVYVKNIFGNVGANISTSNLTVDSLYANLVDTEELIANVANIETLWTNVHYGNNSYLENSNVQTIIVDTISANTYIGVPAQGNEFNELFANIIQTDGLNSEVTFQSKTSVDGFELSLDVAPNPGTAGTTDRNIGLYGDGSGGAPPYNRLGAQGNYPGIEWYSQYDGAGANQVKYKQENLQYNNADPLVPQFPSALWEIRDYNDLNVKKVSYIGTNTTATPVDNPVCQWEWKYHQTPNVDGQPETNKTQLNEQNKISHTIRAPESTAITEISFASSYAVNDGSQDTKFKFTPSTPNMPLLAPAGVMELDVGGTKIWDADKTDMIVYLDRDTYNGSSRDITNSSLQTRGGLWVKKKALIGDQLEIVSNLSDTAIQFYNVYNVDIDNSSNAGTRFEYTTSNTFQYVMPAAVSKANETTPLTLAPSSVTLGDGSGSSISTVKLTTNETVSLQVGGSLELNSDKSSGKSTFIYGSEDDAVLQIVDEKLKIDTLNVTVFSNTTQPVINVWDDNITLGNGLTGNASTVTIIDGERRTFRQEANLVKVGYQVDATNLATLSMNTRVWDDINVNSSNVTTLASYWTGTDDKVFSVDSGTRLNTTDDVTLDDGSYLTVNGDLTANVGFRVKPYTPTSGNYDEDLICINGPTSQNHIQLGTAIVPVSNTTSELTGSNYGNGRRVVNGIVHDSTVDKFAYYKTTSELSYFVTSDSGETSTFQVYFEYSNLASSLSNTYTGNIAFANVFVSNVANLAPVGTPGFYRYPPWGEIQSARKWLPSPIYTLGDGKYRSLLAEKTAIAAGIIDASYPGGGSFNSNSVRYSWSYSYTQAISFQLPYIPRAGDNPTDKSSQGRLYAIRDSWITGVTIKYFASVEMMQGGGGGQGNLNNQFVGYYLGQGTGAVDAPGRPTQNGGNYRRPKEVFRYLGFTQVPTTAPPPGGTPGNTITMSAVQRFDLPSEDWVYVAAGDPFPYVSMVCRLSAGAGNSPGPGYFEIKGNNGDDDGDEVQAWIRYVEAGPEVGTTRGDKRWFATY